MLQNRYIVHGSLAISERTNYQRVGSHDPFLGSNYFLALFLFDEKLTHVTNFLNLSDNWLQKLNSAKNRIVTLKISKLVKYLHYFRRSQCLSKSLQCTISLKKVAKLKFKT